MLRAHSRAASGNVLSIENCQRAARPGRGAAFWTIGRPDELDIEVELPYRPTRCACTVAAAPKSASWVAGQLRGTGAAL